MVSALAKGVAERGVGDQALEAVEPLFDIVGFGEEGGIAKNFGKGAGGGGEDRDVAMHGFERGKAETFVKGGENEGVGAGVEGGEFIVGDVFEEVDAVAFDGRLHAFEDGVEFPSFHSGDDEVDVFVEGFEDIEEEGDVFAWFEGSDGEEVGSFESVGGFGTGDLFGGGGGDMVVEAGGDGKAFGLGNSEEDLAFACGELGDGDDGVGLFDGAADEAGKVA